MNYKRIYDEIIERARIEQENGIRKRGNGTYYEGHHILPRCLNGEENKENIVKLTSREHFICHILLSKIYPESLGLAYSIWRMCNKQPANSQRIYRVSARIYEEMKINYYNIRKNYRHSKETRELLSRKLTGIKRTQEFKDNLSRLYKGKPSWNTGLKASAEHRKRISDGHKNSEKSKAHMLTINVPGRIPWNKGINGEEYKKHFKKYNQQDT